MPLILDPAGWTRPRLIDLQKEMREGLQETLQNLDTWRFPVRDPGSFRTARDLVLDALTLGDGIGEETPLPLVASVVNVQYNAMLAAIDLMKSHSEMPSSVPRQRK